jgi:undecaprenyl-diphosphatase
LKYVILGIIQGLTEFLPVSSQGHLLLFQRFLRMDTNIAFDTVVHLGTGLAAIIYFRKEIIQLFTSRRKLLWLALAATFFTGVVGLSFKDYFEAMFSDFRLVGPFFIVTGIIILLGEWRGKGQRSEQQMGFWDAMVIGLAQGAAIIPSLSRSAMTISSALGCNLDRKLAATFSFMISIPAILGAGLIESKAIIKTGEIGIGFGPLLMGFLAAFVFGMLAILIFMNLIQRTSLRAFAYYCFVVDVLAIFLL